MKSIKNLFIIGSALLLASCQQGLLDRAPYDAVASGNMWTNENLADMGVTGIYEVLRSGNVVGDMYKFEGYGVSGECRDQDYALLRGNVTTGDGQFSGYWRINYEGISRANDAIFNLPNVSMKTAGKKERLIAEAKFLRAFFYYRLNIMFKGVPLYLEPTDLDGFTKGRDSEEQVWNQIISDLTDAINTESLPDKYEAGSGDYGRITKGAAYALRGQAYMWMKNWAKAESDFRSVAECGYGIFNDGTNEAYKHLFKEANEQCEEMIFSLQCIGLSGYGNEFSFRYGSRSTFGSCWNSFLVNSDFVESYENKDGSKFDWDDYIPGYNTMSPAARAVYFLRDGMTDAEKDKMASNNADMSKYLPEGNEERIKKAYDNRDPRLQMTVITPYSEYLGAQSANSVTYTLRWPFRSDNEPSKDLKTDTNNRYYYLFRKFVAEGATEIPNRSYSPIDIPIIRYADVVLSLAECLNEQGQQEKMNEAIQLVNKVRERAGVSLLNSNEYTQVNGQEDLRNRIRNERRWEFAGEGINFFDEMRWKTWHESKFFEGAGVKQIWGQPQYTHTWAGDFIYSWAIPKSEIQVNGNLTPNDGWPKD